MKFKQQYLSPKAHKLDGILISISLGTCKALTTLVERNHEPGLFYRQIIFYIHAECYLV